MISIILIEPEWPSNIGAVARVMANFDFKDLVLINPKCKTGELDAIKRAKHALPILKRAKIEDEEYLKSFDYLIATTSKLSTDYNILRTPILPENLNEIIKKISIKNRRIGLVFGREGNGLYNHEIKKCDFVLSIPTSKSYSAMNLSHAVAIVLYELSKVLNEKKLGDDFSPIGFNEKKHLEKLINEIIGKLKFSTKEKKDTQILLWKRILGKSFLSRREAFAMFGFWKKIKEKIR
jgi:TrmH family RNA methyltransferase